MLVAAAAAGQKPKPLSKDSVAAVDEAVDAEMQRQQLVGVAVGIIRHGEVVLTKGYGFTDAENQIPVTKQTVFNWASNCKPLTAVAAMQLVQKGKLDRFKIACRYELGPLLQVGRRAHPAAMKSAHPVAPLRSGRRPSRNKRRSGPVFRDHRAGRCRWETQR